jgi:site-specific recombinase XerD
MHQNKVFTGPLATHLASLLDEKHALGYKYEEPERLMHEFDEMSKQFDCSTELPKALVLKFIKRKPNWHQATQERHVFIVRTIAKYLIKHDIPAYMIDNAIVTNLNEDFKPYIFSHAEIKRLFDIADVIKPNAVRSHLFYPVILRVQYGCGLRISEALNLRMRDVDLKNNILHVKKSKNNKDRDIPISDSVSDYCQWYSKKIHPFYNEEDYFFKSRWGDGRYRKETVGHYFRKMLFLADIPHGGRKYGGPHLHCLRHTFCVHSMEKMIKEGIPHQVALPLLCNYLGHSSLSATGRYLKLTVEAFPELSNHINLTYGEILPEIDMEVKMSYEEAD